jgi:predicted RNase H-like nuclease (RuvC/YqgF family)
MENQDGNVLKAELSEGALARIVAIEQKALEQDGRTAALEAKASKLESENESLHKRLDSLTDELEQQKAAPAEGRLAELEEKIAKLDEFLGPHGHNRVIPEVIEPQCQSEIAEPQTE